MTDLSPSGFGSWMVADDKTASFGRQSKLKMCVHRFPSWSIINIEGHTQKSR
ncbi:MAG: hypothetical protein PHX61_10965 [Alphaproteobacteria bacterium]|nr:hypothetical protein [Alphaproteobacteria bacterium]